MPQTPTAAPIPDTREVSAFDSSVLITACDDETSYSAHVLNDRSPDLVAYTLHLFEELRITEASCPRSRTVRLQRLDRYCGVFLNDSYYDGAVCSYLPPSQAYEWCKTNLDWNSLYHSRVSSQDDRAYGSRLRPSIDSAFEHLRLTPIQLNNISPDRIFDHIDEAFRSVGADVWTAVHRSLGKVASNVDVVRLRKPVTNRGAIDLDKRMAVTQWMMILNLFGYHRDPRQAHWRGAFFDCLHAASAIFCKEFVTADRRQAYRAAAAFHREGVVTSVKLLQTSSRQMVIIK